MKKQFYYIEEVAEILGRSVASIQGQLARKQYSAVPAPEKLGRRLAWPVQVLDDFIEGKIQSCMDVQNKPVQRHTPPIPAKTGRPTKRESLKRQKEAAHE